MVMGRVTRRAVWWGVEVGCSSLPIVIGIMVGELLLVEHWGSTDTSSKAPPAVVSNAIDASLTAAIAPQAPATNTPPSSQRARTGASELMLAAEDRKNAVQGKSVSDCV